MPVKTTLIIVAAATMVLLGAVERIIERNASTQEEILQRLRAVLDWHSFARDGE